MDSTLSTRYLRRLVYRFRYLLFTVAAFCGFIMLPDGLVNYELSRKKPGNETDTSVLRLGSSRRRTEDSRDTPYRSAPAIISGKIPSQQKFRPSERRTEKQKQNIVHRKQAQPILLNSSKYGEIMIENILGENPEEVRRRMIPPDVAGKGVKIIAFDESIEGIGDANMGGCKEWNCAIRSIDTPAGKLAEAVLGTSLTHSLENRNPYQYYVFFLQESSANYKVYDSTYFNMSLNFLRNSPVSSPYGYTVKLAEASRPTGSPINENIIRKKNKTVAWFASHCNTESKREIYVGYLEEYINVDIFGSCGINSCAHGGSCERMLDEDYFFYLALENSVCRDYITEKLWKHGYNHDIIPIVLKRSVVERYVPPYSFIAIDDFKTVRDLADYLHYLMHNTTAYREYFEWRREYKVLYLDGTNHDQLERPWGFCQLCRLLWMTSRPRYTISNFDEFWNESCEKRGTLVDNILEEDNKLRKSLNLTTIDWNNGS